MKLTGYESFAWAACFIGNVILLLLLFLRKRVRTFPFFTLYIAEGIVQTATLYVVFHHVPLPIYRPWFYAFGAFNEILQLLVVYEIAVHVFRPTGIWARDVRRTLIQVGLLSAFVATMLANLAQPTVHVAVQTFILRANFFSAFLLSELFVAMVVLAMAYGLPWKTHVARIAQAFGAYSLFCVGLGIAIMSFGLKSGSHLFRSATDLRSGLYMACELYWIVMLWAEAPAPRELPESMRTVIYTLQRQVENDLINIRTWRRN